MAKRHRPSTVKIVPSISIAKPPPDQIQIDQETRNSQISQPPLQKHHHGPNKPNPMMSLYRSIEPWYDALQKSMTIDPSNDGLV
jgi:hypothetical protein